MGEGWLGGGGGTRTSTLVLLFQSLTSIFATPPISNENSSAVNKDRSSRGITYKRATVLVVSLLNRITSYHVCNRGKRLFHKKSSTHNKEETRRLNMLSVLIGLAPYFEQTVLSLTCCSRFFFLFPHSATSSSKHTKRRQWLLTQKRAHPCCEELSKSRMAENKQNKRGK